jgi:HEAT repeat protein
LQIAAIEGLGHLRDERALPLLRNLAVNSNEREIQIASLDALEEFELEDAFDLIVEIYHATSDLEVKVAAVEAIGDGEYDETRKTEFLKTVIFSEDGELRHAAIHAAEETSLELLKAVAASDLDIESRAHALRSIGDFDSPEVVNLLFHFLETANEVTLRRSIIRALGDTEEDQAVGILVNIARSDPNLEIRREAIEALGDIGSDTARNAVITLLQEGLER